MKVNRFSRFQQELSFLNVQDKIQQLYTRFYSTKLGKIYKAFPAEKIAKKFKIQEKNKGPESIFTPTGKIRLEYLKCYTGFSDKKLSEELMSNINYQLFCDVHFPLEVLRFDYKLISKIRLEIANKIQMEEYQKIFFDYWSPYIKEKNICLMDATCYESYVCYPSNIKLLCKSVLWLDIFMKKCARNSNLNRIRYKREVIEKYKVFARKKVKRRKERKQLTRRLLYILEKLLREHTDLSLYSFYRENIKSSNEKRIEIIKKILNQQKKIFKGEKAEDKILSIDKEYIRTIIRGKEKNKYEYGAKVHMIQINGINFIEHLNYSAFNECTRMISTLRYHKKLTGKKAEMISGDRIYATNKNRKILKKLKIRTNFKPKWRLGKNEKEEKILRKALNKERSTRLEGSFGTEKEHYGDKRIKARTAKTEAYQILVKTHCRNMLEIGRRMLEEEEKLKKSVA